MWQYFEEIKTFLNFRGKISKFIYLLVFFSLTPATIFLSIFTIDMFVKAKNKPVKPNTIQSVIYGTEIYASLPNTQGEVKGAATSQDARFEILRQYLNHYNSPLEPYVDEIIKASEKYELDFRLLVAIAQQESNLCKKIPGDSYNCWGWGIHERGTLMFDSYTEAVNTVAKGLKEDYVDKGYTTPEQIMVKYTPSSPGSWAKGVSQFLSDMETGNWD